MYDRLDRDFFNRSVVDVARELLGKVLVFQNHSGLIIETEAYGGADDPASHAFKGPTPRSKVMFGQAGISYVYLIYGMYYCLNVVTEPEGSPSAVLIRAVKSLNPSQKILDGPGKICKEMGITLKHNKIDIITQPDFFISEGETINDFITTPRIGIRRAADRLWRFVAITI